MKALDTSALLGLLEGDGSVRDLVRRLRGIELATTEANLLELTYLAARGNARSRNHRRETLERMRRKITVLPIDAKAVEHSGRHLSAGADALPPLVLAAMGALEAQGCEEVFTLETSAPPGRWKMRVTRIPASKHTKESK